MKILYLDGSGDTHITNISKDYPVFVLTGIVVDSEKLREFNRKIDDFKIDIFKSRKIGLHTAEIVRHQKEFEEMWKPDFRNLFYKKLNNLLKVLDFSIITCLVDQYEYKKKYERLAYDLYELSLKNVLQSFYYLLNSEGSIGKVIIEKHENDHIFNSKVKHQIYGIQKFGISLGKTKIIKSQIKKRIKRFKIVSKKKNINGLQIGDLCSTTIGRQYLNKKINEDYSLISQKYRVFKGSQKFGFIIIK